MKTPSRDERIAAALEGLAANRDDQASWRLLFGDAWPFMVSVCARLLGDPEAAQDAAQEALVRIARYAPFQDLRQAGEFRAYARTVCRRVAHARQTARRIPSASGFDEIEDVPSDHFDPGEAADAQELLSAIVRTLDEDDGKLLHMTMSGYSLQEIADTFGISYDAAGVRVHRVRNRIRKWLRHL